MGAEPDVTVWTHDEVGLEHLPVPLAQAGIDAVRGDDEVGVRKFEVGIDLALEGELDAKLLAARLEDVEQLLATDADEAMPRRTDALPLELKLDVVPVVESALDLRGRLRVPDLHRLHRRVGKDDAPTERVVGPVALHDRDRMIGMQLLHQ